MRAATVAWMPEPRAIDVVERLIREQPSFHAVEGERRVWNAGPETLRMITGHVGPGHATAETGSGASTVVFAACGARHVAVSPHAAEHERVRAWCCEAGVSDEELRFVAGYAEDVLPGLGLRDLDAAFVDGKHSFPHPVIDWHYLSRALRVGGVLMLDDLPVPAVAVVARAMLDAAEWELLALADDRAAAFRKLAQPPGGDAWQEQPFNRGFPDYSFARRRRRAVLAARHSFRRLRQLADRSARRAVPR